MLLCPKCGNKLVREERVWRCQNNHSYDIAKRGYVNLALHHKALSGDDREMVKARTRFLSHGYYAPLQAALVELVRGYHPSIVIDAGCGEGYYTNRVKQETDTLLGFDSIALSLSRKVSILLEFLSLSVSQNTNPRKEYLILMKYLPLLVW